jgi:hypothetical protein
MRRRLDHPDAADDAVILYFLKNNILNGSNIANLLLHVSLVSI